MTKKERKIAATKFINAYLAGLAEPVKVALMPSGTGAPGFNILTSAEAVRAHRHHRIITVRPGMRPETVLKMAE